MYVKFDIIGKILLIIEFAPPVSWWKVQWGCLRMGMVPFYFQEVRMNNFKVVYRILKYLERRMDNPSATIDDLDPERLGISRNRMERLLHELERAGYVAELLWNQSLSDARPHIVPGSRVEITLKGLEYLAENSLMQKAGNLLKSAADVVL